MNQVASTDRQSMLPLLMSRDKLIVERVEDYKINDIVVFLKDERLVAHRVIYKRKDGSLITKGDNNLKSDGEISKNKVLGKVEKLIRKGEEITLSHIYLLQSTVYLKELKKIKSTLDKEKIPFLVLKGLPLHLYYKNSPPKRIYKDTDILVAKKDFKKAGKALERIGFSKAPHSPFKKEYRKSTQISFYKRGESFPIVIDLHMEPAIAFTRLGNLNKILLPKNKAFIKHLLNSKREVKVEDTNYPILKKESLVVYLLLHYYHHNFKEIHRLSLINKILEKETIKKVEFENIVNKHRLNNFIWPSILFFKKFFPKNIHAIETSTIKPRGLQKLAAYLVYEKTNPFDQDGRVVQGVKLFIITFLLSPAGVYSKLKALTIKETITYFSLTIKSFFSSSFRNLSASFSATSRDTS